MPEIFIKATPEVSLDEALDETPRLFSVAQLSGNPAQHNTTFIYIKGPGLRFGSLRYRFILYTRALM